MLIGAGNKKFGEKIKQGWREKKENVVQIKQREEARERSFVC